MRLTRLVGVATLVLLAACRGDAGKNQANQAPADTTPPVNEDSVRQQTAAKTAGGISGDTVGLGFKVVAEFTKDTLTMTPVEIPPGEVTIIAQNKSSETHRLEIVGVNGGRWRTLKVTPGGTVTLNSTMLAGNYDAYDPDMKDKGFKIKLVVK